jgi:hypothetical protein
MCFGEIATQNKDLMVDEMDGSSEVYYGKWKKTRR